MDHDDTRQPDIGSPLPFAHYDTRGYDAVSVVEGYAGWARIYADFDRRFDLDLLERSVGLSEGLAGARVLDMACGTGRIGAWCMEQGAAQVVGVDLSPDMLSRARTRGCYAEVRQASLTDTGLAAGDFDGVITSMALCHVEQLSDVFQEARRLLRPQGWFGVVDYHSFFLLRGIPSHYDHPETGQPVAVINHIHSASAFFNTGHHHGFTLREFEERFVTPAWVEASPSYQKYLGWPITFWMFFSL